MGFEIIGTDHLGPDFRSEQPSKFWTANEEADRRVADLAAMQTAVDVISGCAQRGAIAAKAQGHDDRALLDILAVIERVRNREISGSKFRYLVELHNDRARLLGEAKSAELECGCLRRDNTKLREQADGLARANESLTDQFRLIGAAYEGSQRRLIEVHDARDEALIRQEELHQSLNDARAEVVRLTAKLEQARAVEEWHGIASGGQS